SGYQDLSVGTATSYAVTGLSAGTTYYYRVRALNANGPSANSSVITAYTIPAAPAIGAASAIVGTSFTATWTLATGGTAYYLDVSTDSGFATFVSGYQNLALGYTASRSVTGLANATTYYYRVRASNGAGTSVSSAVQSVTTLPLPAAPVATAATGVGTNG